MTDRELLELAAKAAGMWKQDFSLGEDWLPVHDSGMGFYLAWGAGWWNPITNDGDALRLAVKLRLHIEWRADGRVAVSPQNETLEIYSMESSRENSQENARRAIVRAAAYIGSCE